MDSFIEVTGAGYYDEHPVDQWVLITISVRAAKQATSMREVDELRRICLSHLQNVGFTGER
jgi:hypothetical protein